MSEEVKKENDVKVENNTKAETKGDSKKKRKIIILTSAFIIAMLVLSVAIYAYLQHEKEVEKRTKKELKMFRDYLSSASMTPATINGSTVEVWIELSDDTLERILYNFMSSKRDIPTIISIASRGRNITGVMPVVNESDRQLIVDYYLKKFAKKEETVNGTHVVYINSEKSPSFRFFAWLTLTKTTFLWINKDNTCLATMFRFENEEEPYVVIWCIPDEFKDKFKFECLDFPIVEDPTGTPHPYAIFEFKHN